MGIGRGAWLAIPAVFLLSPAAMAAPDGAAPRTAEFGLTVEGISTSVGEDNPRVLYILPWQPPTLPRRQRQELESAAPALIQPVDAEALERQRAFRESLNPLTLIPGRESAVSKQ
ncbi:hypothetical protein LPB19_10930 [Marinobacter salinisoli]|uniref:Uncharacterized protein n=2 Tax=Marinobacter salinisoli TaxID=2769486 RepID=A0ABX7MZL6_9GAMM|nr:hypothetical protein LPB19_10930 [Marinobacter salinisoli]